MSKFYKHLLIALAVLLALVLLYFWAALSWSYSDGERAGWVQKLSRKGVICKTWEGELALVTVPGANTEKFMFTVRDPEVAQQVYAAMGRRVSLRYEEKVGLPTSCWGDTRHFVTGLSVSDEIPLAPGVVVNRVSPGAPTVPASAPMP
jgi:hypothetical protein